MKKIILPALMLTLSLGTFAQKDKNSLQFNAGYGSKIENVGFGLAYNWVKSEKTEFSPSINFYPEKNGVSVKEINFDYHRLITINENVKIYPIIGFCLAEWNDTAVGANLGLGGRYSIAKRIDLGAFFKYSAMSNSSSQSVPMLSIAYKL